MEEKLVFLGGEGKRAVPSSERNIGVSVDKNVKYHIAISYNSLQNYKIAQTAHREAQTFPYPHSHLST